MLAELEELGMQLARATADLALPDAPEVEEAAELLSGPPAVEPLEVAPAASPRRTTTRTPGTTPRKSTDPVTSFLRLATAVCACIALEARIALGPVTTAAATALSPTLRADPRRKSLREAFIQITEHDPDRVDLRRALLARIDADLTADPDRHQNVHEVFCHILDDFELEPDTSKLPDDDPFFNPTPNPRATSPP